MKVHGIMKDGTTACGLVITPELEFWCTQDFKNTTCKKCLIKMSNDLLVGNSDLITKKRCKVTIKFMENTIKILRDRGLKRLDILERLDHSHSTFVYLKQGKTRMSLREALRIASILNLSVDYLSGVIDSQGNIL